MDVAKRQWIRERAGHRCESCGLPQEATPFVTHHVEHIVSRQHGGTDEDQNLALACDRCNAYKGPNLTTLSTETGAVVELYHPRRHFWTDHFGL